MLRIKDNVDLKELEKFDFHYCETLIDKNYWVFHFDMEFELKIYENDKILRLGYYPIDYSSSYTDTIVIDILYDLIQAGLVEKVKVTNNE